MLLISLGYLKTLILYHLNVTQQPSSQILQVINHKKAESISFQANINVEVLLQQYSFRN